MTIETSYVVAEAFAAAPKSLSHLHVSLQALGHGDGSIRLYVELCDDSQSGPDMDSRIITNLTKAESKGLRKALKRAEGVEDKPVKIKKPRGLKAGDTVEVVGKHTYQGHSHYTSDPIHAFEVGQIGVVVAVHGDYANVSLLQPRAKQTSYQSIDLVSLKRLK